MSNEIEKVFVTIEDGANMLSVGRDSVYTLIHSGQLPSVKIGRFRRFRVADIDAFGHDQGDIRSLDRSSLRRVI